MGGQRFILRTNPDGTREASWRHWVLVWVTPVCFLGGALWLVLNVYLVRDATEVTEGEVVKVYEWDNDAPEIFYPGDKIYSPVYRYIWTDGTATEATAGTSHTGWNFPIGTKKQIRYYPDRKDNVTLVGPSEWWVVKPIAVLALITGVLSVLGTWVTRRWLARGAPGPGTNPTVRRS